MFRQQPSRPWKGDCPHSGVGHKTTEVVPMVKVTQQMANGYLYSKFTGTWSSYIVVVLEVGMSMAGLGLNQSGLVVVWFYLFTMPCKYYLFWDYRKLLFNFGSNILFSLTAISYNAHRCCHQSVWSGSVVPVSEPLKPLYNLTRMLWACLAQDGCHCHCTAACQIPLFFFCTIVHTIHRCIYHKCVGPYQLLWSSTVRECEKNVGLNQLNKSPNWSPNWFQAESVSRFQGKLIPGTGLGASNCGFNWTTGNIIIHSVEQ
ncbi:hypothetical protein PM082_015654 [Marasmius tenuissimus]|nr:hypothetical protein PM082_015654 [Marasmius tenuissimus]